MDFNDSFEAYRRTPDSQSVLHLLEASQQTVYNLCAQVLGHSHDAEDVAQKVLLDLIEAVPKLKDSEHCLRWLHTAALHGSLNVKRGKRTRMEHERRKALQESVLAPSVQDLAEALHEHLDRLDGELRSVLVEHYFDKKSLDTMARERKCSSVAIWKKLDRARGRLRESLARMGLGAILPQLDSFLSSLSPFPAPRGLITPAAAAKVASLILAGGFALKITLISALVLIAGSIAAYWTVGAIRRTPAETAGTGTVSRRRDAAVVETGTSPARPFPVLPATPAAEPVLTFASSLAYARALQKAMFLESHPDRWRALRRIGFALTDDEFIRSLDRIHSPLGSSEFVQGLLREILLLWTDRDPVAAASYAAGLPRPEGGSQTGDFAGTFLDVILPRWGLKDDAGATRFAEGLPPGKTRSRALLRLEAQSHPARMATTVLSLSEADRPEALNWLAASWNASAPEEALAWGLRLKKGPEKDAFVGRILARFAEKNLDEGLARYQALSPDERTDPMLVEMLGGAAQTQGGAALDAACRRLDLGSENACRSIAGLVRTWAFQDPGAAVRWSSGLAPTPENRILLELLKRNPPVDKWAERNPEEVIAWITSSDQEPENDAVLRAAIKGFSRTDRAEFPKTPLALIERQPESSRPALFRTMIAEWAEFDPVKASRFAQTLPAGSYSLESLAQHFGGRDVDAAVAWADGLKDAKMRDQARSNIAIAITEGDVSLALSVADRIVDEEIRTHTYRWIAGPGARADLAGALEALKRIPNPQLGDITPLADRWIEKDPVAAVTWVRALPLKDDLAARALQSTINAWSRKDREAAARWLQESDLSQGQKASLLMNTR